MTSSCSRALGSGAGRSRRAHAMQQRRGCTPDSTCGSSRTSRPTRRARCSLETRSTCRPATRTAALRPTSSASPTPSASARRPTLSLCAPSSSTLRPRSPRMRSGPAMRPPRHQPSAAGASARSLWRTLDRPSRLRSRRRSTTSGASRRGSAASSRSRGGARPGCGARRSGRSRPHGLPLRRPASRPWKRGVRRKSWGLLSQASCRATGGWTARTGWWRRSRAAHRTHQRCGTARRRSSRSLSVRTATTRSSSTASTCPVPPTRRGTSLCSVRAADSNQPPCVSRCSARQACVGLSPT
mmetsp:Transcript_5621/g.18159  ORF Transcript_5621/g.18159 Transcript_5621/m.18159 type:complete len:298 (-) Transcript_5621:186-1079(-)